MVMTMVMDIVRRFKIKTCERRDGNGDGHCYRVEAVWLMIDVMAMVMDIVV